jgi:hypothetical protein
MPEAYPYRQVRPYLNKISVPLSRVLIPYSMCGFSVISVTGVLATSAFAIAVLHDSSYTITTNYYTTSYTVHHLQLVQGRGRLCMYLYDMARMASASDLSLHCLGGVLQVDCSHLRLGAEEV